jgi:hypothetical protein
MPVKKGEEADFDLPTPEGMIPVRIRMILSSNIVWIGWPRAVTQSPLMIVEFQGGSRYIYFGVTRQKAVAAAYAESSGEYLNKEIKPNHDVLKIR